MKVVEAQPGFIRRIPTHSTSPPHGKPSPGGGDVWSPLLGFGCEGFDFG